MSNTLKTKIENTKLNFAKNLFTSAIIPACLIVLAVVFAIVFGFNKGMDFKGGITVSVVAESQNLEDSKTYENFKNKVDAVIQNNGVRGSLYIVETEATTYSNVLVVKIDYTGKNSQDIVDGIRADLKDTFFATISADEVELRNLISVSTFGGNVDSWEIMATILACFVAAILVSIYILARNGVHAGMLSFLSVLISNIIVWALIMIVRVPLNKESISIIPMVTLFAAIFTFLFTSMSKKILTSTEKYEKKSNYELANDTVKRGLYITTIISVIAVMISIIFTLINIATPVLFFGLCMLVAIVGVIYTNLFIIPAIFGLTYVRKIKKQKVKKEKNQDKKLTEEEVMKETDLNNLYSN